MPGAAVFGPAGTPELPLCFSSHERFSCLSLNFQLFVFGPFSNSTSITGTSWLSARYPCTQQRVTSIAAHAIHPALWRRCSGLITMEKIHSGNYGTPEPQRDGSEVAGRLGRPGSLCRACFSSVHLWLSDFRCVRLVCVEERRSTVLWITILLPVFRFTFCPFESQIWCISFPHSPSLCGKCRT